MAAIGGFRSDLSITRKTDEHFDGGKLRLTASLNNCIQRGLEIFSAKSIIP